MKWVKRGLWMTAWGGWAWLGVGLHRELPRWDGPVLKRLDFTDEENPLGFFSHGDRLATITEHDDDSKILRLWDVARTRVLSEHSLAKSDWRQLHFSARHGIVLEEASLRARTTGRLRTLDLESGRWTDLAADGQFGQFHPHRPWASFSLKDANADISLAVADLRTGRQVFTWTPTGGKNLFFNGRTASFFLPDDLILIPVGVAMESNKRSTAIEIWRLDGRQTGPAKVFNAISLGEEPSASATGLIAWTELASDPISARVFSPALGTVVATFPPHAKALEQGVNFRFSGQVPKATFAADGRTLFFDAALWGVSTGHRIWEQGRYETVLDDHRGKGFVTLEFWSNLLGDWAKDCNTTAVRDYATGGVLHRKWMDETTSLDNENLIDPAHMVSIDASGGIRPYPPPPNYSLLAFCQTILALPLVLLWAMLRWRRKQRMRLAGVSP